METAWCPEGCRRQPVEDRFTESEHTRQGEVEYAITQLACGHYLQSGGTIVGASPGAPWAPGAYGTVKEAVRARVPFVDPFDTEASR